MRLPLILFGIGSFLLLHPGLVLLALLAFDVAPPPGSTPWFVLEALLGFGVLLPALVVLWRRRSRGRELRLERRPIGSDRLSEN